jgi:hypothetical protein
MGFLNGLVDSVGKSVSQGIEDFDFGKLFNNAAGTNTTQPVTPVVQYTPANQTTTPQVQSKKDYTNWYIAGGAVLVLALVAFLIIKYK